jgi:hypothetical protein
MSIDELNHIPNDDANKKFTPGKKPRNSLSTSHQSPFRASIAALKCAASHILSKPGLLLSKLQIYYQNDPFIIKSAKSAALQHFHSSPAATTKQKSLPFKRQAFLSNYETR